MESSSNLKKVNDETVDYLKQYAYNALRSFTNNFDTPIGSGGFGSVYKGKFPNGMQIAVKILKEEYVTEELFMDEVWIMGRTYHHRLVRFLGYFSDSNRKGLVYEYMENGSLDAILHKKERCIEWDKLYNIMIATAEGMSYLHDERIIHHDIKPANILLDSDFSPKVADFGLAKLMNRGVTHVTVARAKGTCGYVAPEMAMVPFSHVTPKCDVYSFGMMLFDILGMSSLSQNEEWFLEIVWEGFQNGQLDKIIEDCGTERKDMIAATKLSMVAFWCVQYTPATRPSMRDVVKMLSRDIQITTPPNPCFPSSNSTAQPLKEAYEDKVTDMEIADNVVARPENEDVNATELPVIKSNNLANYENRPQTGRFVIRYNEFARHNHRRQTGREVIMSNEFASYNDRPQTERNVIMSNGLERYNYSNLTERDDILIKCVMEDHGFCDRIPVAAVLMYKCISQWCIDTTADAKAGHIFKMIGSAMEEQYDHVPYWLSNTFMLLFFLVRGFKVERRYISPSTSWFQRVSRSFRQGISHNEDNNVLVCEPELSRYDADRRFRPQLAALVERGCKIIQDKLKEDLSSSLSLCIQAPTMESWISPLTSSGNNSPTNHWHSIVNTLNVFLKKLQDSFVPEYLTTLIFSRTFYQMNLQLFNGLLENRECCSLSYGEYVKAGLYELDHWCDKARNYVGSSRDQLKHTRQAIGFVVTVDKSGISIDDLTKSLCPDLSISQLYRICKVNSEVDNHSHGLSSNVLGRMEMLWDDSWKNNASCPLLLKDNSHIPFSFDIYEVPLKMEFSGVKLNIDIARHPRYEFFLK